MPFEVQHQVTLPENTFLRAKLTSLEERVIPYTDKSSGEQKTFSRLNWTFEITEEGEFWGKEVRAETPAFLSDAPHNAFRNWSEALLQRPLDLGQVLNESDLIGLSGLVTIGYETDRRDPAKKWPRVAEVIPLDPNSVSSPPF